MAPHPRLVPAIDRPLGLLRAVVVAQRLPAQSIARIARQISGHVSNSTQPIALGAGRSARTVRRIKRWIVMRLVLPAKHFCDSGDHFRVSRAQRSASPRCAADPGPTRTVFPKVPGQRRSTSCCTRPGHAIQVGRRDGRPLARFRSSHHLALRYRLYAEPRPAPTCGLVLMNSSSVSLSTERVCSEPSQFGYVLAVNFIVKVCFSSSTV